MKISLTKLRRIIFGFGDFFKKHPCFVFLVLIGLSFTLAAYVFYQKAYLATNFSPAPSISRPKIDETTLSEIQTLIDNRQKNIDEFFQKTYRNPFE